MFYSVFCMVGWVNGGGGGEGGGEGDGGGEGFGLHPLNYIAVWKLVALQLQHYSMSYSVIPEQITAHLYKLTFLAL